MTLEYDSRIILNIEQSRVACIYQVGTSEGQMLVSFSLRSAIFEIQGYRESEMHQMTSQWP